MDTELIQEFVDSRGVELKVDNNGGVIRGVKILGLASRNGRDYPPETLKQAAVLYEDAKVNVNHPAKAGAPRDYQDRMGIIRHVVVESDGLYGDFFYNPHHPLAKQLEWDAEHAPENVGFSHNVGVRVRRKGDRVLVEEITRVQSVDLVADPATTRGLFEQAEDNEGRIDERKKVMDTPLTLAILEADHGELVEAISRKAIAGRDDATVIEKLNADNAKLASEAKTLVEQVEAAGKEKTVLVEKIDVFEAVEKLAKQKTEVDALVEAAKLPEALVTDVFRESMLNADADRRKALIEDRQTMAKLTEGGKPRSREQGVTEGETKVANAKEFVSLIT
jgi:hypothetical protein